MKSIYKVTKNGIFITPDENLLKYISEYNFYDTHHNKLFVSNFFLPELIHILNKNNEYTKLSKQITKNTWMNNINKVHPKIIKFSNISSAFKSNIVLKAHQKNFINIYQQKIQKYNLKGFMLSFEQGLGKTITALALMEALDKKFIIIICPKSIISTVWESEIKKFYKKSYLDKNPDRFIITNYESVKKLPILPKDTSVGFIVDETHNLRNSSGIIYQYINDYIAKYNNRDVLAMSGTPIKARANEIIPILYLIDPHFNNNIEDKFKDVYNTNSEIGIETLKNRFGVFIHRKEKEEVLKLPQKHYKVIYQKIPNGDKYTIENVKKIILDFVVERKEFYNKKYPEYKKLYTECIDYFDNLKHSSKIQTDFIKYKKIINKLENKSYGWTYPPPSSKHIIEAIKWLNIFEKKVIYPTLTSELKKNFMKSKAVVKYVSLKIEGEWLGKLLNDLRTDMFSELILNSNIAKIVKNAKKKTICFTTFKPILDVADKYFIKNKLSPLVIKDVVNVTRFRDDINCNPLIATIKKMSTGTTLTEANTVIFLSPPWRDADKKQAEDRVHRIGQDTDVFIYDLLLDTGNEKNLSTRMDEVVKWSAEAVNLIMTNK